MCSDAPDTGGINRAAEASAALSKEALDWYKQTYANEAPLRQQAADKASAVADAQIEAMKTATTQANELYDYNKATFRPIEQRLATEAQAFDTPERRMQAAAAAAADVDSAFSGARDATMTALGRTDTSLSGGKALSVLGDTAIAQAKARAGATTQAVRNVEQQGWSRMADVANMGRGIASAQATQQQIATNAGTAGVNASNSALGAATSGTGMMSQGFSTAIQGQKAAGDLYGQAASIQQNANDGLMDGLVGLGGLGVKLWQSDETIKKGTGRMASTAKALAEVKATPVHDGWEFDPAKGGPDDGGQKHIGPMAQDVQRISGDQAAPGGKVINLPDRMGRMEAAVQELAKQVDKLKGKPAQRAKTKELEAA